MFNPFIIIIFINSCIICLIHILQHIYFYKLYFQNYYPKLVRFIFNHRYNTITVMELIRHLHKAVPKSHATKLVNLRDLPELFQHSRTAVNNPEEYLHVSAPFVGYDAMSFHPNNLSKISIEKNTDLVTFLEKKMLKQGLVSRVKDYHKQYSIPKLGVDGQGIRPAPADHLEIGTYSPEVRDALFKHKILVGLKEPSVSIEDYSNVYVKVDLHPKHGGLGHGTIISDSAFEEVKWFYDYLKKNEELFLYVNNLLDNDPNFPF